MTGYIHFLLQNTKHGERYSGEERYAAIMKFILNKLEIDVRDIVEPLDNFISRGSERADKPMLIFICGEQRDCFTSTERLKIAAIFVSILFYFSTFVFLFYRFILSRSSNLITICCRKIQLM